MNEDKLQELERFYEANRKQIAKDVARELTSMKRAQDETAWIPYGEDKPVIHISLEDGEETVRLYYSFDDMSVYKVL